MIRCLSRYAAAAALLLFPAVTRAQTTHDHACLDAGCTRLTLFDDDWRGWGERRRRRGAAIR